MIVEAGKWVVGRLLRLFPERWVGRILPGEYRFTPADIPPVVDTPGGRIRLYIAPVNYAGQAWQWARALERNQPGIGARNSARRGPGDLGFPADSVVPLGVYTSSRRWQRAEFAAVTEGFTHVMIESLRQPFGAILDESVETQVRRLRDRGINVLMLCHGTDVRLPSRHVAAHPDSPFLVLPPDQVSRLEQHATANRRVLDSVGAPVLVSTPDLLIDVPDAVWLPVVVDPLRWSTDVAPLTRHRPLVVHAPSKSAVKGSDLIDPVLRRLDAEGLIEYRRISGVPVEQMPDLYRDADIVLDQFRIGSYGVAACEAMAAGRVVIGQIDQSVRDVVANRGIQLPIVESRAADLEMVIGAILADRAEAVGRAAAGPEFVSSLHDGRVSAQILAEVL